MVIVQDNVNLLHVHVDSSTCRLVSSVYAFITHANAPDVGDTVSYEIIRRKIYGFPPIHWIMNVFLMLVKTGQRRLLDSFPSVNKATRHINSFIGLYLG